MLRPVMEAGVEKGKVEGGRISGDALTSPQPPDKPMSIPISEENHDKGSIEEGGDNIGEPPSNPDVAESKGVPEDEKEKEEEAEKPADSDNATVVEVSRTLKVKEEGDDTPMDVQSEEQEGRGWIAEYQPPEASSELQEFAATPAAQEEVRAVVKTPRLKAPSKPGKGSRPEGMGKGKGSAGEKVKRRPGRPVGSIGPYKRKKLMSDVTDYGSGEVGGVRVSSRQSTSIFKHDISAVIGGPPKTPSTSSPYVYPTAVRTSQLAGGKPSMAGFRKALSKGTKEKDPYDNVDPLTGKRRYNKKKKFEERRDTFDDYSDTEVEPETKFHLSDNGVWRPTDDLRLIVNMEATSDLESVYYGVKFSCYFSYKDIEERWKKIMYNDKSSLVAQNAINALHPDVTGKIYYESLFSPDEEKLISEVNLTTSGNPSLKVFQTMLDENPHVFNKHRTARSLLMHWLDMKDFHLLSNQNVLDYKPGENFIDFEDVVCENEDDSDDDIESDAVLLELKTQDKKLKKKLRLLDDEINAWQAITGQLIEDGMKNNTLPPLPTDFDSKTYALLRGKEVYYGMTSREIVLGRSTADCKVDADLTEEGASKKFSRKQAIIKLKGMGKFVIINKGKRPIFVDKKVVPYRCAATLHDQSVIQIAQVILIFFINEALISRLIERDVSGEVYASFKDLEADSGSPGTSKPTTLPSLAVPRPYPLNPMFGCGNYALPFRTGPAAVTGRLTTSTEMNSAFASVGSTSASSNVQMGEVDGSPISQPPASYVTIS